MRQPLLLCVVAVFLALSAAPAAAQTPEQYRTDARSIEPIVNEQYAYLDRLPGGAMPMSAALAAEREAVSDARSLLRYAERALLTLADPHAITGSSLSDSWAVVPSYSDLWVEPEGGDWRITAVRAGSPAEGAGVKVGDRLVAIGETSTGEAVEAFWADLGLDDASGDRAGFAARILAAGRRDRPRDLTVAGADGSARRLTLPNLYATARPDRPPVEVGEEGEALVIRIDDALGDGATIAAFDTAMAKAEPGQAVILDLTDTPRGGNTVVARAIMGWFVDRPTSYQIHNLPAEARETTVPRQWIEQVLPRPGKHHDGPVTIRVGRWTGSMGEGLAVGFHAIGAEVVGGPMAGLLGAIYDHRLEHSGLVLKLPTERLLAVDGTPRERFAPAQD